MLDFDLFQNYNSTKQQNLRKKGQPKNSFNFDKFISTYKSMKQDKTFSHK